MKTFKNLVNEIYEPNTPDEGKFIGMHVIKTFDYPVKNDHGLPFRDDTIKQAGPQHKKPASYDPPKEAEAAYKKANEEVEQFDEAGMSASTIKHKTNISKMSPSEFANHSHYSKMSDKDLQSMAWRHGYGGPGTSGHNFYVNKRKKGMNEETSLDERKLPSMTIHVTPASYGKHEVLDMSHDVEAKHPKTGQELEPGHSLTPDDVSKLKKQGHNVEISEEAVSEKTLTPAEMKKREEVAKAIKREHPGMPMGMKMAIATKTAKRVAEEAAELRLLMGLNPVSEENEEVFESDDMLSLLQIISDRDTTAEVFFEGSEEGVEIDKEVADLLLKVYENLDEEGQEKFEYALTESDTGFDYCVDFAVKCLEEEAE